MRSEKPIIMHSTPSLGSFHNIAFETSPVFKRGPREEAVLSGFQARSKDQVILEEGGGAGPSLLLDRRAVWTSFASSCPSCSSTAVHRTLS